MLNDNQDLIIIDLASFFTLDEMVALFLPQKEEKESSDPKVLEKHNRVAMAPQIKRFVAKKQQQGVKQEKSLKKHEISEFLPYYMESITQLCLKILNKATLEKEDQLSLNCQFKRIAWENDHDSENGHPASPEYYFEKLEEMIIQELNIAI